MTTRARAFYLLKESDKSDFIRFFKSDFILLFKIRSTALKSTLLLPTPLPFPLKGTFDAFWWEIRNAIESFYLNQILLLSRWDIHLTKLRTTSGVNKKPKNFKTLAWISGNFITVWQGESGELKIVCQFFQFLSVGLINRTIWVTEPWQSQIAVVFQINKDLDCFPCTLSPN